MDGFNMTFLYAKGTINSFNDGNNCICSTRCGTYYIFSVRLVLVSSIDNIYNIFPRSSKNYMRNSRSEVLTQPFFISPDPRIIDKNSIPNSIIIVIDCIRSIRKDKIDVVPIYNYRGVFTIHSYRPLEITMNGIRK